MKKRYSIAQARDQLPGIVHEVEGGQPVELTRRGTPVAVLLSIREYDRLFRGLDRTHSQESDGDKTIARVSKDAKPRSSFDERLIQWRAEVNLEDLWEDSDPFADVRDRSAGRDIQR